MRCTFSNEDLKQRVYSANTANKIAYTIVLNLNLLVREKNPELIQNKYHKTKRFKRITITQIHLRINQRDLTTQLSTDKRYKTDCLHDTPVCSYNCIKRRIKPRAIRST